MFCLSPLIDLHSLLSPIPTCQFSFKCPLLSGGNTCIKEGTFPSSFLCDTIVLFLQSIRMFVPYRGVHSTCALWPIGVFLTLDAVQQHRNLIFCTISIEHCNDSNNALPMTQAQVDASNRLNLWLCKWFNIAPDYIHPHSSINPIAKPFCPGPTFDLARLKAYIQKGGVSPYMEQQFDQAWASVAGTYVSGIAKIVKQGFLAHCYSACYPTS